jgi:hypothetical protein
MRDSERAVPGNSGHGADIGPLFYCFENAQNSGGHGESVMAMKQLPGGSSIRLGNPGASMSTPCQRYPSR